ncbi:MBL fold hydrolase [Cobetia sp. AM6]|nr:MBL fold hydrolase [Cobetia sp. AM6]
MLKPRVQVRQRQRPPLHLLPLGGCGEIGMNLTLYGYQDHWIAVDCGMMIRQDLPEGPLQVPDIESLASLGISPQMLVITHGHEDHIGAVAWLWPKWRCPIIATPLAAGLLRAKFAERELETSSLQIIEVDEGFESGPFALRLLPLTHSIPESCSLLIVTPEYRVMHTGDWKLDPEPLIGEPTDPERYQALAPVDLVVGDSTNAPLAGHSRSEGEVARALEKTLAGCRGRVVVTCFASNLARILALGRAAARNGRRITLLGRSMERMVRVARGLGYLEDFPPLVPVKDLGYLPPEEVMVIATGSQGEPRAALSRLANSRHPDFELAAGDTVIFSSKAIPGNELAIGKLHNALTRLGVGIMEEKQFPDLHASGHPAQEELRTFYGWLKPVRLLPVHGEYRHQLAHTQVAQSLGIEAPLIPVNGDVIRLDAQGLSVEKRLTLHECIIEHDKVRPLDSMDRRARARLGRHGSVSLALPVTLQEAGWVRIGRLMLDISGTSSLDEDSFAEWLDDTLAGLDASNERELKQQLDGRINRWLRNHLRHEPVLFLHIMAMNQE